MPTAGKHPNLLLVFGDQQRAGMTRVEGNPQAITPAIDSLGRDGTLVEQCIANSPVCCPSRGTMWTGTWPTTHRVISNDLPVRTDLPTLATVARDAGYRTGYIGKWHLDGVPRSKFTPPGPRRLGFDDFWAAYNCSHNYFDAKYFRDTPDLIRVPGYEPTVQTDLAIDFLKTSQTEDRPFCLALSWGPPHDPYAQVPEQYRAMFDPQQLTHRPNVEMNSDNPLASHLDPARTYADYYAAITALDAELARLLAALDQSGMADDTLVIFTSDHGDMLWSHGWMKKQAPYEESIHVPMILRGPGICRGVRSDLLMGLIDLMPTALGLLGLPVPDSVEGTDHSSSLRSGVPATNPSGSTLIANYHSCDEAHTQQMPEWRGVRTTTHTYVEQVPGTPWLLFDNNADPFQQTNLIDSPTHALLRMTLADELRRWLVRTNDPFISGGQLMEQMGLGQAWIDRGLHVND